MAVIPEQHEGSSADRDREEGPCVDYISFISSGKESHVMLVLSQTKYLSFLGGEEDFLLMLYWVQDSTLHGGGMHMTNMFVVSKLAPNMQNFVVLKPNEGSAQHLHAVYQLIHSQVKVNHSIV